MRSESTRNLSAKLVACLGATMIGVPLAQALPPPIVPQRQTPRATPAERPAPASLAELTFTDTAKDFGRIFDDQVQEHEFEFTNTGVEQLRISLIKPSCGCTLANVFRFASEGSEPIKLDPTKPDELVFAPGERGRIGVTFNPKGKHGDTGSSIRVFSNDKSGAPKVVNVQAFVRSIVQIDPPLVNLGQIDVGTSATKVVRVIGLRGDFEATRPTFQTIGIFDAKVLKTESIKWNDEDVRATTIEITLREDAKPGTYNTKMHVRTNDDRQRMVDVSVFGVVKGPIEVVPPRIAIGNVRLGQPFNRSFIVRHRDQIAFKVTSITAQLEELGLEFDIRPRKEGVENEYIVTVKGQLDKARERTDVVIRVQTDLEEFGLFELPLIIGRVQ